MMNKKSFAWCRAAAALVLAVVFLAVTGFAFVDMLAGPASVSEGAAIEDGAYLETDVTFIMDIVGVEKNAAGKEVAYYAVSPVGSSFMMIRYPLIDSLGIQGLEEETRKFLEGESLDMAFRMIVTGVAVPANDTVSGMLAEWFAGNVDWMVAAGVIPQMDDYSAYISPYVIEAGTVGTMSYGAAVVMTVLAALLVVYAIVEAVLILGGAYNKKPAKKGKKEKTVKAEASPVPVESESSETEEEPISEETETGPENAAPEETISDEVVEEETDAPEAAEETEDA